MKRNLLLALIIALSLPILGNPVDENTAKQLAQNFWKENNIMGVKGDKVFKKKMDDARFVNVATRCGYSEFYIFNNEDDKGFVIIAADDCVTPVLGYSYDNNFAAENLPPNLKGWLDGYAEQIRAAVEMRATATEKIRTEWECLRQGRNLPIKSETAVAHLLTTTWNQGQYYNSLCPFDYTYNQRAVTGCVATAMAQIMKYWSYPEHGIGFHSYVPQQHPQYGTQYADFNSETYYWSYMPNTVNSFNSSVATLMYHCGVSVNMNYGIGVEGYDDGSEAIIISYDGYYEYCAENALKTFFDYKSTLQGLQKNNYADSQWINLIKNELNNSRPILYGGFGTGGHAFVCDGYNNSNLFHFNWGWGGECDGHFAINNLNPNPPYGQQQNYSNNQVAIIGIEPDDNSHSFLALHHDVETLDDLGIGNFHFGEDIGAYAEVINIGNEPFSGYIGAAVFDNDDFVDFLGIWDRTSNPLQPNYYQYGNFTHEGGIPFIPSYEHFYNIKMMYSTDGLNWSFVEPGEYHQDIFNVFITDDLKTNSEFTFSNGEENALYHGEITTINIDVINEGTNNYNGVIWLALVDANENLIQIIDTISVYIPVGGNFQNGLDFTSLITAPEGLYYLALFYHDSQNNDRYVGSVVYENIKPVYVYHWLSIIEAASNPTEGGIIDGVGTYSEGETCILTATANNGYTFINWTENGAQVSANANYSFTVTGDRNMVANFQPQLYTISVSSNPSNGGSVSTTGELSYNFDNGFDGWTSIDADGDGFNWRTGSGLMGTGYGHNGSSDILLSQSYDNDSGILYPDNYLVSPQMALGGSISFWVCAQDSNFPSEHFGVAVSTTSNTNANSFTTIQEWTLTAKGEGRLSNHSRDGNSRAQGNWHHFTVDLSAYSGQTGYIAIRHFNCSDMFYLDLDDVTIQTIGGSSYLHGQTCTVTATANSGYTFINWTENGTQVSTNPNYTFTVTGNRNLVANFQIQQHTISVTPNPSYGGSVSGGGTFNYGQSCTVNALANSGYTFVNWTENGTQASTNANYTFIVSGNRNLVANFTSQSYVITATTDPSTGGFVTGSGGYSYGETCTITATANTGYTFLNWTKNGTQVSVSPSYSFTVTESAIYTAHFNAQNYTITVATNPNNAGSASGGGSYTYGQTCTVTASANNGYAFTSWTENGTQVSTNVNYSFTVTGNRNLVANFVPNTHTIQATAGSNGTITPSGNITVALGANQSFSMIPDAGYEVQEVYIDGNPVGAMNSYTFTNVTDDHYIHVTFTLVDAIDENSTNLIQVYPNPTMGEVIIEAEGLSHIQIVNLQGQTVYSTNVVDGQIHIDLSQMAKGIYFMHIEAKGRQVVRKIVVE